MWLWSLWSAAPAPPSAGPPGWGGSLCAVCLTSGPCRPEFVGPAAHPAPAKRSRDPLRPPPPTRGTASAGAGRRVQAYPPTPARARLASATDGERPPTDQTASRSIPPLRYRPSPRLIPALLCGVCPCCINNICPCFIKRSIPPLRYRSSPQHHARAGGPPGRTASECGSDGPAAAAARVRLATAELAAEPRPGAGRREPGPAPGRIGAGTEVGATLTRAGRAPGLGDPRDGHAGPG